MDFRMPMQLYRGQEHVGLVTSYSSDQPWAMGRVEDFDTARGERSKRAALFNRWLNEHEDDPPEDDAVYYELLEQEMARRDVDQVDLDWCERGVWTIRTQDGINHPVYSLDFLGDRFIQWRW
ncbi:hypothetical protein JK358_07425 [Nocardia sp. 2]|uniref:Uncharacterized protein n=1 Tax=Nocardia acididurans TaxID=2802282 RepID=A0ABS1M1Y4_9NOCA|nr:hypothetical protein [Nocardia acididurans]MBL1074224.1 hypothetical protein [Nocardia acididurans]